MATIKEKFEGNTAGVNTATELLKVLGDREGQFVWKQLTAEGGDFVAFVTADDENSYPDGGTQDGYWYEVVKEGSAEGFDYEYSGSSNFTYESIEDSDGNLHVGWTLKLLTSGILNVKQNACDVVDIFLVGGGGGGGYGEANLSGGVSPGGGGGGGYTNTLLNASIPLNTDISIIIGAGGSAGNHSSKQAGTGGTTSFLDTEAVGGSPGATPTTGNTGGKGGAGGSGGGGGGVASAITTGTAGSGGKGQGTTTRAFCEDNGTLYASGGAGGNANSTTAYSGTGGAGGTNGSNGSAGKNKDGKGSVAANGASGGTNTGNGGGGGGAHNWNSGVNYNGGSGGSGIIILRGRWA